MKISQLRLRSMKVCSQALLKGRLESGFVFTLMAEIVGGTRLRFQRFPSLQLKINDNNIYIW
jgi:hypothetical protein